MTATEQYNLGVMYANGQGVPQDYAEAARWYRKAADLGFAAAQAQLGNMYCVGQGVPQDYAECARWFRKAADQAQTQAVVQYDLGVLYANGQGVPQDYVQAAAWYRKAADQGLAAAQFSLGWFYDLGHGVPRQDYVQAAAWYRKAADQGNADAQRQLGVLYRDGLGVPQDYAVAAAWVRKAANQGDAKAQSVLGVMYDLGLGMLQDYVQAYMWLNLAAAGDVVLGNYLRDQVARKMSREQIAQAQEMARNWKPTGTIARDGQSSSISGSLSQLEATGTGFFVTGQGHLVTNYHVIDGCNALKAQTDVLNLIARDKENDLALLKSTKSNSQFAIFSGGPVRVGQPVMAVGYPLRGLLASGANVTTGNVSALAGPSDDTRLLQITAPVQPGNSGGPLLDQSGNVIGVVVSKLDTLKIARATGDIPQNVNFAINPLCQHD